jgi:hypothetical protein
MVATEPENKFQNCVFIKLHTIDSQRKEGFGGIFRFPRRLGTTTVDVDLELTIRFGVHEIEVPGGRVRVGIKRGKLKLRLENGKMPLEKMLMTGELKTSTEVEEQNEIGGETEGSTSIGGPTFGKLLGKSKKSSKKSEKSKYVINQVFTQGTEEKPVWIFEAPINECMLKGQLSKGKLGSVEIYNKPCLIEATFEVKGSRDLYLGDVEGLLKAKDLSRNKTALLTTEFLLRWIAPSLQPYLSRVEVEL